MVEVGNMDNQRIESGTRLGREQARDGDFVRRVGTEAIDGLGRKGDHPAVPDKPGRRLDR